VKSPPLAIAVSPDNSLLATGILALGLWDLEQRKFIKYAASFPTPISGIAFSPDSQLIAAHSLNEDAVVLARDGKLKKKILCDGLGYRIGFSADGTRLNLPFDDAKTRGVWGLDTGTWEIATTCEMKSGSHGIVTTSDGKFHFVPSWRGELSLFDAQNGRLLCKSELFRERTRDIDITPDDEKVAVSFLDGTVRVWDLPENWQEEPETVLDAAPQLFVSGDCAAHAVRFLSRNEILTSSDEGEIRLWDLEARPKSTVVGPFDGEAVAIEFLPESGDIIVALRNHFLRYSSELELKEKVTLSLTEKDGIVESLTVSDDGSRMAFGTRGNVVIVWNLDSNVELHRFSQINKRRSSVLDLDFSTDGRWLAIGSNDHSIRVRSTDDWQEVFRYDPRGWGVNVEFDGNDRLAYSDTEGEIGILECGSWKKIHVRQTPAGKTSYGTLRFDNDRDQLIVAHHDAIIRIYTQDGLALKKELRGHPEGVRSTCIHRDGQTLLSSSDSGVRLWHLPTNSALGIVPADSDKPRATFSNDGKRLALMFRGEDGFYCRVWEPF
ncbi:MAG: WD40 repeat domain-containing protein, partial [Planctomycetota bacterium]